MNASNAWNTNQIHYTVHLIDRLIAQISDACATIQAAADAQHQPPQRQTQTPPASAFRTSNLAQLKPLMLTLHCIFSNELLLALDLLDRGFVRPLVRSRDQEHCSNAPESPTQHRQAQSDTPSPAPSENLSPLPPPKEDLFFVLSASTATSTSTSALTASPSFISGEYHHQKGYEVRLQAWNCTCPSFTLAAFRDVGPESPHTPASPSPETVEVAAMGMTSSEARYGVNQPYSFGGTLTRASTKVSPPVCKHILASLLAAACPGLVGEGATPLSVRVEELAGLCAG